MRLKTNAQVGRIFGLAAPKAVLAGYPSAQEYIEVMIIENIPDNPRISQLTFDQANSIIKALGGDPFTAYGHSRRTENYRKQAAGIKTIETEAHLTKIREPAAGRGMSADGIAKLATRMRLPWPPSTTEQGNKLVEALKAMNARDAESNVKQFPTGVRTGNGSDRVRSTEQAEPAFRRVA